MLCPEGALFRVEGFFEEMDREFWVKISGLEAERRYKDQHMVERNFAFPKIRFSSCVNTLFLKSPSRIEALGLVLILALMIWRLMERTMRLNLRATKSTVTGWVQRKTSRPTSLILTTKFLRIYVLALDLDRRRSRPLNDVQLQYLEILDLTPNIFLNPFHLHYYSRCPEEKIRKTRPKRCGM